jgi:hypothetical protein
MFSNLAVWFGSGIVAHCTLMNRRKAALLGSTVTLRGVRVIPLAVFPLLNHLNLRTFRQEGFEITLNDDLQAQVKIKIHA